MGGGEGNLEYAGETGQHIAFDNLGTWFIMLEYATEVTIKKMS